MTKLLLLFRLALIQSVLLFFASTGVAQPVLAWRNYLSTATVDLGTGISYDGLNGIYVTGTTLGSLGGPNAGSQDGFVAKYNTAGDPIWIRQFGSSSVDESNSVSADGLGNVFVTGSTQGTLGGPQSGQVDAYIANYNAAGSLQWIRQFGTPQIDGSNSVAADRLGNAYISGHTDGTLGNATIGNRDAIVAKFDSSGNQLWLKQTGTASFDSSRGVSTDQTSVYLTGFTDSNGQDYFLEKRDAAGNFTWSRLLGSSSLDQAISVAADNLGNAYVCGLTNGLLGAAQFGASDAFVSKFDGNGNVVWTQQLGSSIRDRAFAVVADQDGNIYVGGDVNSPSSGTVTSSTAFVTKLDPSGSIKWTYNVTDSVFSSISGLTVDGSGSVYAIGMQRLSQEATTRFFSG